jgi:hypothetical protein
MIKVRIIKLYFINMINNLKNNYYYLISTFEIIKIFDILLIYL